MKETFVGIVNGMETYEVTDAEGKYVGINQRVAGQPDPSTITARQIRLWLVTHGVSLAAVETAIDAIQDASQREMVRVEWEYAPYIERSHPMLLPLAAALGMTSEQVDGAFREAATL